MRLRQPFKQHCRLAFECGNFTHAEQPGGGIKQAPTTRSRWAVEIPLQHLPDRTGSRQRKAAFNFLAAAQSMQGTRSHPPGFTCGTIATGQCQFFQMPQAFEASPRPPAAIRRPRPAIRAQAHPVQRQPQSLTINRCSAMTAAICA